MCGIVGYVGSRPVTPILLDGLGKLEYRGYDSAGVAVWNGDRIEVEKAKGRLSVLRENTGGGVHPVGCIGIGHTRWATHGKPSDINSHPQTSGTGRTAVVHNGIIENYYELRQYLISQGVQFVSDTDTEVVAQLFEYYYNGDLLATATRVVGVLEGSYALGILNADHPDTMVALRRDAPLLVGVGEGENFIASDVAAILKYTRDVYYIDDKEIALVRKQGVEVYDQYGRKVDKELRHVDWDVQAAEKGGYEHFFLKEIMEQPEAVRATISPRIKNGRVELEIPLSDEDIRKFDKIYIAACGSAYYVGVAAGYLLEELLRVPTTVQLASEFRYQNPIVDEKTLVIIISQSGETADSRAALREAKSRGATTLAVVNVVGSSIAREADMSLYTWAGPEISVATTKAYSTQLAALYLLAIKMADARRSITDERYAELVRAVEALPTLIERALGIKEQVQQLAAKWFSAEHVFFIGRNTDYAVTLEGALKLKELSYTMSEAYAGGELKHGPISLIEDGTPVMAVMTGARLFDKTLSNVKEVLARGASIAAIVGESARDISTEAGCILRVPDCEPLFSASLSVIPLQFLAYYIASLKGCDIDKPRNLAKSVTVE